MVVFKALGAVALVAWSLSLSGCSSCGSGSQSDSTSSQQEPVTGSSPNVNPRLHAVTQANGILGARAHAAGGPSAPAPSTSASAPTAPSSSAKP